MWPSPWSSWVLPWKAWAPPWTWKRVWRTWRNGKARGTIAMPNETGILPTETRVPISSAADIVTARQRGRALALELGFEGPDVTVIAAAISEVSRNIVEYAK